MPNPAGTKTLSFLCLPKWMQFKWRRSRAAVRALVSITTGAMSRWQVEVTTETVRVMSLDELDAAFQSSVIEANTRVRQEGEVEWTTLGDVAGLDDDPTDVQSLPRAATEARSLASTPPLQGPNTLSPFALSIEPSALPLVSQSLPFDPSVLAALDDAPPSFKPNRRPVLVLGAIGGTAFVLALGILGLSRLNAANPIEAQTRNAMMAPAAVVEPPSAEPVAASDKRHSSDEQRAAVAELDKKHQAESEKKRIERTANTPPARTGAKQPKNSADPYVKRGNNYAPLNGPL